VICFVCTDRFSGPVHFPPLFFDLDEFQPSVLRFLEVSTVCSCFRLFSSKKLPRTTATVEDFQELQENEDKQAEFDAR